jgi:hypothetical protein
MDSPRPIECSMTDATQFSRPTIDITDIIALVLLAIWSLRRLDIKVTDAEHNPSIPREVFESWKREALNAHTLATTACFLKVTLNLAWYFGAGGRVPVAALMAGGAILFIGWALAVTIAWRRMSNAYQRAAELGVGIRTRAARRAEEEAQARRRIG